MHSHFVSKPPRGRWIKLYSEIVSVLDIQPVLKTAMSGDILKGIGLPRAPSFLQHTIERVEGGKYCVTVYGLHYPPVGMRRVA